MNGSRSTRNRTFAATSPPMIALERMAGVRERTQLHRRGERVNGGDTANLTRGSGCKMGAGNDKGLAELTANPLSRSPAFPRRWFVGRLHRLLSVFTHPLTLPHVGSILRLPLSYWPSNYRLSICKPL
jgi:hypothetical protein